jgi:GntR family transcriptional regulator
MELVIDLDSPVPVYEQLRSQLAELVESGRLPPEYVLPSVRRLAADLGVAPGTIARAYRELQSAGVVAGSRSMGTRVSAVPQLGAAARRVRLAEAADRLAGAARRVGAADDEVIEAVARALSRSGGEPAQ